jgi:hypothetical protein
MTSNQPAESPAKSTARAEIHSVVIRSWPKIIFLYPVMLTAFLCGLWQSWSGTAEAPVSETAGMIFFTVLALDLLVISFDFSRFKLLSIFFFVLSILFLLLYLSTRWEVLTFLKDLFRGLHISASTSFYYALSAYLFVIMVAVYISTRFDYWEIRSNEILHREGFLGDVKRFPSPNLKMTKEISDVFEFLLLGSGRIVLFPASEKQAIVLDHVLAVNAKERAIQELLSTLAVEIEPHHHQHDEEDEAIGTGA